MVKKMLNKEYILENGGATLDFMGEIKNFDFGYMVSKKGCELVVDFDTLNDYTFNAIVRGYMYNVFGSQVDFVGLWLDNGKLYFDVSTLVRNLDDALQLGKSNEQLAIFDNENKQVINL